MARVIILGSGVMGTSIAVPVSENGHEVLLVGSPLDDKIIQSLQSADRCHPKIGVAMSPEVASLRNGDLSTEHFHDGDILLIGVSSTGIPWVLERICKLAKAPALVMMITKGLDTSLRGKVQTLPPMIEDRLHKAGLTSTPVVGIGGPCIAKELAERQPTAGVFASRERRHAERAKTVFQRPYYNISISDDFLGVEACAALKNFMAIAIAYTWTKYPAISATADKPYDMNPSAAWFQQAVNEISTLCEFLGGNPLTAYGLAGLGDLFVTVNAGRNSRMGQALGQGLTLEQAFAGPLIDETVEGVDTGRELSKSIFSAIDEGRLDKSNLPLTMGMLKMLSDDKPLSFDMDLFFK